MTTMFVCKCFIIHEIENMFWVGQRLTENKSLWTVSHDVSCHCLSNSKQKHDMSFLSPREEQNAIPLIRRCRGYSPPVSKGFGENKTQKDKLWDMYSLYLTLNTYINIQW